MGYKPWEYRRLLLVDFWAIEQGYRQKQTREFEERAHYFRMMYGLVYNIHRGEKTPALKLSDILPLSFDRRHNEALSDSEKKEAFRVQRELLKQINKA